MADPDTKTAKLLEQLLANNRQPKVSELRMALIASSNRGEEGGKEALAFLNTKVSGPSQALMAFSDAKRLYRHAEVKVATRKRNDDDLLTGGGLVDGVGLYATCDIEVGEQITEFDVHAICSSLNNDSKANVYFDPRLVEQKELDAQRDDGQDTKDLQAMLEEESITVNFGHTRLYYVPLVLHNCQYKQWMYANDTMPCPDPEAKGYDISQLVAYRESASRANCMGSCPLGLAAYLVATRPIKAGDEILYHWGSKHWEQLRALGARGLWQVLTPPEEEKQEEWVADLEPAVGGLLSEQ